MFLLISLNIACHRADNNLCLMKKGLWLMEVFKVVYHNRFESKPNRQFGTIKIDDGVNCQYLYKVNRMYKHKPLVQHMDELVLTGPRNASISANKSITIDVNLFGGTYKDSFYISTNDTLEICSPLERRIISKDGRGEIIVLYAIFNNATQAHVEVRFLAHDDFTTEIYGVVAASTSKIESSEHTSLLFAKKPSDKIKVQHCKLLPLSRSIIAVPLNSKLNLAIRMMIGDDTNLFEKIVTFQAERTGTHKQLVEGKSCKIQVKVTWNCA